MKIQFTSRDKDKILGHRADETLRWIHHPDNPEGCGFGIDCETCTVRRTVLDTFKTGGSFTRIEAKLVFKDHERGEKTFLASTALLDDSEKEVPVLIEERINQTSLLAIGT